MTRGKKEGDGPLYLFERRSLKLFLINGGYHTLQFAIIGVSLALIP